MRHVPREPITGGRGARASEVLPGRCWEKKPIESRLQRSLEKAPSTPSTVDAGGGGVRSGVVTLGGGCDNGEIDGGGLAAYPNPTLTLTLTLRLGSSLGFGVS